MYVSLSLSIYIYTYTYMYMYMYVYIYIYIYIYIHMRKGRCDLKLIELTAFVCPETYNVVFYCIL